MGCIYALGLVFSTVAFALDLSVGEREATENWECFPTSMTASVSGQLCPRPGVHAPVASSDATKTLKARCRRFKHWTLGGAGSSSTVSQHHENIDFCEVSVPRWSKRQTGCVCYK